MCLIWELNDKSASEWYDWFFLTHHLKWLPLWICLPICSDLFWVFRVSEGNLFGQRCDSCDANSSCPAREVSHASWRRNWSCTTCISCTTVRHMLLMVLIRACTSSLLQVTVNVKHSVSQWLNTGQSHHFICASSKSALCVSSGFFFVPHSFIQMIYIQMFAPHRCAHLFK